ncbi:MAG TPA: serine hydrolase [Solirubrobacteraceae bacterium]
MRAVAVTIGLLVACATAGAGANAARAGAHGGAVLWREGVAAARSYAAHRRGTVSFALRTPARAYGWRAGRVARSASVVKAMLLVAYLRRGGVRSRALTVRERALLGPMIRRSDNVAATRIHAVVGADGLRRVARAARMRAFVPHPVWGGSQITAADQARYFQRIDRLIPARHRAYAMSLLATVVPAQRWGIGRVPIPAGWQLFFKGGWGSGTGEVDHQVALLRHGRARVSLAILTTDNPDHEYGNETLREVAERLLRGLHPPAVGTVVAGRERSLNQP